MREHCALASFYVSTLSRQHREYMVSLAHNGLIQLSLLPLDAGYHFSNRIKDLSLRALECFAREPSLRRELLSRGFWKFARELLSQHSTASRFHRRSMLTVRTLRLITRRFPRFLTVIGPTPEEAEQQRLNALRKKKGDFFANMVKAHDAQAYAVAGAPPPNAGGGKGDVSDGSKGSGERWSSANLKKHAPIEFPHGLWQWLASKGVVKTLLDMSGGGDVQLEGNRIRHIHADAARILRNITEDGKRGCSNVVVCCVLLAACHLCLKVLTSFLLHFHTILCMYTHAHFHIHTLARQNDDVMQIRCVHSWRMPRVGKNCRCTRGNTVAG